MAVDDEGVGIPATERALVTEPFHRAWNVRESRIPGTGLGLYICRRLVEAHGGRLWLEDRPDGRPGTRVLFTLPLLRGRRQTSRASATTRPPLDREPRWTVAETILIVEDEPEFAGPRRAVDGPRRLSDRGRPDRAPTRCACFYEDHPDLVILDVSLPGLDGWQIIARIREFSRIPILMVTARSSEADKIRGLKLGADDYITKPLSFPELSARVEAALRRASTANPDRPRRLQHRDLVVDLGEHRARLRGDEIRLTPTEFRLLAYLVEHAGQLVTHRQVLGAVWGAGYDVDVHLLRMTIRNLRLKLDAAAPGEAYIATEYGLGYRLTGPARPVEGTG